MEGYGVDIVLIAISHGPPLALTKAFSRSGCGRFFSVVFEGYAVGVSIGVEWCPLIGVQKGPLWRCGEQARGGVAFQLAQPTRACVLEGGQALVLMRQLSLPVSTMSQWWVRRSSSAVVIFASPKTVGHSPNARLVVTMTEVCS